MDTPNEHRYPSHHPRRRETGFCSPHTHSIDSSGNFTMQPTSFLAALVSVVCLTVPIRGALDLNLGPGLTLDVVASSPTVFGTRQARLLASCYGVPVSGFGIVAEQDSKGVFTGRYTSSGNLPSCTGVNTQKKCSVADDVVEGYIAAFVQRENPTGQAMQRQFAKQSTEVILQRSNASVVNTVDISYQNDLFAIRGVLRINACTGALVSESNIAAMETKQTEPLSREKRDAKKKDDDSRTCPYGRGGNSVLGVYKYGDGDSETCLPVSSSGGLCSLQSDAGTVVSAKSPGGCQGAAPVTFPCDQGPNDAVNGANSPSLDAMSGLTTIRAIFREWYGMSPPTEDLRVCVNFGHNFSNGMWDGRQILLGDGRCGFSKPFVTIGSVCHEYGHVISEYYFKLSASNQAECMMETFSDAFSRACRNFAGVDDNWYEGRGLINNYPLGFRSYANPKYDGVSIDNVRDYTPGMDSHYTAGVFNKFFYCLAEEKGTSIREAFRTLLLANQLRWVEDMDFEVVSCDVLRSAVDVGVNTDSVRSCLASVGISVDSCSLDNVEQVLCTGNSKVKDVTVSASRNPYFRLCASNGNRVTVRSGNGVNILVSTGSPYSAPVVSGSKTVTFNGDLSSGKVYVRLRGTSDKEGRVDVYANF